MTLTDKTNQKDETVTFNQTFRGNTTSKTVNLKVGGGASLGYNGDSYPCTVWGWRVTKGGAVFVYITDDDYRFEKAPDFTFANQKGEYIYTQHEPTTERPAREVKLSKRGCNLYIGHRAFYNDPHK